tara:strand:- start:1885 stop:3153 length:1269 start_codon:yes stop_codon:yes gene_type:complete
MRVDIIGAGPTGVTVAWLMSKTHEVHVWEHHDTCGGSWWEPGPESLATQSNGLVPATKLQSPDLHAPRVVFKEAFVNTNWLFDEMGLDWNKYFKSGAAVSESIEIFLKRFSIKDYFEFVKFLILGFRDDGRTIKDHLEGKLTPGAERLVATLPIVMDGVDWTRMTAWEFIQSFNIVALSSSQTQRISGRVMGEDFEKVLKKVGVKFHFKEKLVDIEKRIFKSGKVLNENNLMILCLDPKSLKNLYPEKIKFLEKIEYGCVNILLHYDERPKEINSYEEVADTKWNILPTWLYNDSNILSCVLVEPPNVPPEELLSGILKQLGLPFPKYYKFCWGSEWDGIKWVGHQSSGIYDRDGMSYESEYHNTAICGMMSKRWTPYASIEAAIEVGRDFCGESRKKPMTLNLILYVIICLYLSLYLLQSS